jgi:hypothetical protein
MRIIKLLLNKDGTDAFQYFLWKFHRDTRNDADPMIVEPDVIYNYTSRNELLPESRDMCRRVSRPMDSA